MTPKDLLHLDDLPGYDPIPLPFSWSELPRRQCEPGGYKSIAGPARWTRTLSDGRDIVLRCLHQYFTYAGVVAGLPTTDEVRAWPIEGALRLANQLFECEPSRIALLPPEIMASTVVTTRKGKREAIPVDFLPAVCSIGTFESKRPAQQSRADGSEVVIVWFQGSFGPPEAGHVTEAIRTLAWGDFAYDLHSI